MQYQIADLFDDYDISRILCGISAITNQTILPQKTFVFLDEVQEIPKVLALLKYFCENAPDIHIAISTLE